MITINSLIEDCESMLRLLHSRYPQFAAEIMHLDEYADRLQHHSGTNPLPQTVEALELEFYGLIESSSKLRTISSAATYLRLADKYSARLKDMQKLSRERSLDSSEMQEKQATEEALTKVRNAMEELLDVLTLD
jgi:hypothetical protein